jgi:hypothetical protein
LTGWLDQFVAESAARLQALPPDGPERGYLQGRGVTLAYQADYALGWLRVPEATTATPAFWTWLSRWGWESFVFPLRDPLGAVTGVVLRSLASKRYENYIVTPKELCPPAFGLDVALPVAFTTKRVILVEGIFDYFALRHFTEAVVAQLTSIPSLLLQQCLGRYCTKVVSLADMDKAGRRAAYRLAGVAPPPEYREPNDPVAPRLRAPRYHVVVPAYSAHDPADLLAAGKLDELRRLSQL